MPSFYPVRWLKLQDISNKHWRCIRNISDDEIPCIDHMLFKAMKTQYYYAGRSFQISELSDGYYATGDDFVICVRINEAVGFVKVKNEWHGVRSDPFDPSYIAYNKYHESFIKRYAKWQTPSGIIRAFSRYVFLDIDDKGKLGVRKSSAYRLKLNETNPKRLVPMMVRDGMAKEEFRRTTKYVCEINGCMTSVRLEKHHLWPLYLGGLDICRNLVYLCEKHHNEVHHNGKAEKYTTEILRGRGISVDEICMTDSPVIKRCQLDSQWSFLLNLLP